MFTRAAGIRSLLRVCTLRPPLSLSLSHTRARALFFSFSPAYHGFSIPLFLSSSLPCPSSFYSLVNAPFVNRPRVGFRKIPIADRLRRRILIDGLMIRRKMIFLRSSSGFLFRWIMMILLLCFVSSCHSLSRNQFSFVFFFFRYFRIIILFGRNIIRIFLFFFDHLCLCDF